MEANEAVDPLGYRIKLNGQNSLCTANPYEKKTETESGTVTLQTCRGRLRLANDTRGVRYQFPFGCTKKEVGAKLPFLYTQKETCKKTVALVLKKLLLLVCATGVRCQENSKLHTPSKNRARARMSHVPDSVSVFFS